MGGTIPRPLRESRLFKIAIVVTVIEVAIYAIPIIMLKVFH